MAEVQQLQAMEEHQSDKLPGIYTQISHMSSHTLYVLDIADTSGNVLDQTALPSTDEEQTDHVTLPSIHRKGRTHIQMKSYDYTILYLICFMLQRLIALLRVS